MRVEGRERGEEKREGDKAGRCKVRKGASPQKFDILVVARRLSYEGARNGGVECTRIYEAYGKDDFRLFDVISDTGPHGAIFQISAMSTCCYSEF